jgi:hypothetical protein
MDRAYEESMENKGLLKVGWFHTHPGHGIFMSQTDRENHSLYRKKWQVALVIDPVRKIHGFFHGGECAPLSYVVMTEDPAYSKRPTSTGFDMVDVATNDVSDNATKIYQAVHKHRWGGKCRGQLQLCPDLFLFSGTKHVLRLNKSEIRRLVDNRIIDENGETWHFVIEGKNPKQTKQILCQWFASGAC